MGEKRCFLPFHIHFKLAEYFHSVSGGYIQFNYFRKSRESAKNRPVLDDLLDTCQSYLVQAKVELLKVMISKPPQSTMHAFPESKLWRMGRQFPRDCTVNLSTNRNMKSHKHLNHCYYSRRWMRHWWAPRTSNPSVRH